MKVVPPTLLVTVDVPLNVIVTVRVVVLPAFGPLVTVTVKVRVIVPAVGQPLPPSVSRPPRGRSASVES